MEDRFLHSPLGRIFIVSDWSGKLKKTVVLWPLAILLVLLPFPCLAQNQVTAATEAISPVDMTHNPKLQKMISLHIDSQPLNKVLEQLSKESGISLHLEDESLDDLGVIAYTHQMPLGKILDRIAELFTLSWRFADGVAPTNVNRSPDFILYESPQNTKDIYRLQKRSWDMFYANHEKQLRYATTSDDSLKQLAEQGDTDAAFMMNPSIKDGIILLSILTNRDLNNLIGGKVFETPANALPDSARNAVENLLKHETDLSKQIGNGKAESPTSLDNIRIQYALQGVGGSASVMAFVCYPDGKFMSGGISHTVDDSDLWVTKKRSHAYATYASLKEAMQRKVHSPTVLNSEKWTDILFTFYEKYGLNVFSDAYNNLPTLDNKPNLSPITIENSTSLSKLLFIDGRWGRSWWPVGADGKDFLFLNNSWFHRRLTSAFQRKLITRLKNQIDSKIAFSLDDLADLAQLPPSAYPQVESVLHIEYLAMLDKRNILRFYGTLNKAEKRAFLKQGINLKSLSPSSKEEFEDLLLTLASGEDFTKKDISMRLTVEDNRSHFHFFVNGEPLPGLSDWSIDALPASIQKSYGTL